MNVELEALKGQLMTLPLESRAWLAENLIQSLDQIADADATSVWLEEVRRRDTEISNGTAICKPAVQVLLEAQEKLQCLK